MRLLIVAVLVGCATKLPLPASDNATAENFVPPVKDALLILLPAPQSKGTEEGENIMSLQLQAQIKAAGYRVAVLQKANYEQLWAQEVRAVGGIFDGATGAVRAQAFATAMGSLARRVCAEAKCALMIRQRMVIRSAKVEGTQAEWDGTRLPLRISDADGMDYKFNGTTSGLSIELVAVTDKGLFAFRRFGGAAIPFETNLKEAKNELRKDLFKTDTEIARGVRLALEPILRN